MRKLNLSWPLSSSSLTANTYRRALTETLTTMDGGNADIAGANIGHRVTLFWRYSRRWVYSSLEYPVAYTDVGKGREQEQKL